MSIHLSQPAASTSNTRMTEALIIIDKLVCDNHPVWEVRMRALLISKGYWKIKLIGPNETDCKTMDTVQSEQILALVV